MLSVVSRRQFWLEPLLKGWISRYGFDALHIRRDALIRVTVKVQNPTRQAVTIADSGGRLGLWVEVLNANGAVVYSSEGQGGIPGQLIPPAETRVLQPGQSLQAHPYIVLSGSHIRAVVNTSARLDGRPTPIQLTRGNAPHLLVYTYPDLHAVLRSADIHERGKPLITMTSTCADSPVPIGISGWVAAPALSRHVYRLSAACAHPLAWHLAAGWLNEPVVDVEIREPPARR
ncbi:MAG: hypothetical protein M3Z66_06930 [Chloroflexota bacterium]|nr:hypothetical protein [Chloroflexota bacterium]